MKNPSIPMSPDQLPQQRIVPVASIPARPNPFDAVVGWNEKPDGVVLANGPSNPEYLGQVEWAWSRMNNRVDAYYVSRGRSRWMLWLYSYDDNWGKWDWLPIGYVQRKDVSLNQAAFHLLIDFWQWEKDKSDLDHFHWINEEAYLDASQWRTIALVVWSGQAANDEKTSMSTLSNVSATRAGSGGEGSINTLQEPFQSAESPETSFADGSPLLQELKEELLQRGMSDAEAEAYLRTL